MFDLVPLAGAGGQMAHLYGEACFIGEALQGHFP
jgi:hypothetical protein